MNVKNIHNTAYKFSRLIESCADLAPFVFKNNYGNLTVDFSDSNAVFFLNKALLIEHYGITDWVLPKGSLCPAIPSRVDYIHYIADLILPKSKVKGLDIGVGASAIYPILAAQCYNWSMVGTDINNTSIEFANKNIKATKGLSKHIEIRQQHDRGSILKHIIQPNDWFTFTMCNPPFFTSKDDYEKAAKRKQMQLYNSLKGENFGGIADELYCNGGEALFIKRLIKESTLYKTQVQWFTTLVSQKSNLPKLEKQLLKLKTNLKVIPMSYGKKQSRILAWQFK